MKLTTLTMAFCIAASAAFAGGSVADTRAAKSCNGACHSDGGSGDTQYYFWERVHGESPSLGHWSWNQRKRGALVVDDSGGALRPMRRPADMSKTKYQRYLDALHSMSPKNRGLAEPCNCYYDMDGDLRPNGY